LIDSLWHGVGGVWLGRFTFVRIFALHVQAATRLSLSFGLSKKPWLGFMILS
jgi:hypothetical protein